MICADGKVKGLQRSLKGCGRFTGPLEDALTALKFVPNQKLAKTSDCISNICKFSKVRMKTNKHQPYFSVKMKLQILPTPSVQMHRSS